MSQKQVCNWRTGKEPLQQTTIMNQKTRNQKTRNKKKQQNLETSEKIRFSEKSEKIRKILKISDFQKKSEKF